LFAARQNRVRLWLWAIVPAYLLLHGIVATCLPDRLAPLSTFCIVLAELAAIAGSLRASRKVRYPARMGWLLLVFAMLFHSTAMSLDMVTEITQTPVFNFVPGFQIYFSMLYGVPLLIAVSLQSDRRIWSVSRAIYALLSLSIGAVLYLEIFSLLTMNGSTYPADAVLIAHIFDGIDFFLAAAATIRWLGSNSIQESSFFRILAIFLWINTVCPSIHNRIMLHHDYVWLDLLISTPYVVLFVLTLTSKQRLAQPHSPALVRAVRSGSPIFLAMALVCAGMFASRSHFYVGLAAELLAIAGYGALSIFAQSRVLETEESLLASKERLERLIGVDSVTGIANRHAFDKALDREIAAARRTKLPMSLLMIDVDQFKQVNDELGHQTGDEYLNRIAGAIRAALPRATDFAARYGGDEFSAILAATDSAGAMKAARKLHQCVTDLELQQPATHSGTVTVSIGLSTCDGSMDHSPASLVSAADRALYLAKKRGRNCSEFLAVDGGEGQ
jgi:diguanylate cyclase (GGDEF)-like protein